MLVTHHQLLLRVGDFPTGNISVPMTTWSHLNSKLFSSTNWPYLRDNLPPGVFDPAAAARGDELFSGKAKCNNCHVEPLWSDPGWNLHTPAEVCIDSFQANGPRITDIELQGEVSMNIPSSVLVLSKSGTANAARVGPEPTCTVQAPSCKRSNKSSSVRSSPAANRNSGSGWATRRRARSASPLFAHTGFTRRSSRHGKP